MAAKKGDLALVFGPEPTGEEPMPEETSPDDSEEMGPSFDELASEVLPGVDPDSIRSLLESFMEERGM
jgi:hypothetical protein